LRSRSCAEGQVVIPGHHREPVQTGVVTEVRVVSRTVDVAEVGYELLRPSRLNARVCALRGRRSLAVLHARSKPAGKPCLSRP